MNIPELYALSSGESSFTSSSSSDHGTPLTPPTPLTHDTSRSSYHISDIASFASSLQDAANQAFPNRGRTRYHTINVCLIRWQEDELKVQDEVDYLHDVFDQLYGFNTEIWLIPSRASQIQLTSMTCMFLQKFDEEGNLFIVYYGGHGKINAARGNEWWCSSKPDSSYVDWSAIQTLFGTARSDVLILLDCCAAASSAVVTGTGTMEAIAACGWETTAPSPGDYSFTHTLIEVLEEWVHKPSFSAAMLHTEVLFVLKQKRPERGMDGRRTEWCSTPVHWVYTSDPKAQGIELSSLRSAKAAQKAAACDESPRPRASTYVDAMDLDHDPNLVSNPLTRCQPNGDYSVPHVLISIALEGDQGPLDAVSCRRWLADFPALAKYATVEGVYKSYSTLMTLSVPVMVWDLLPAHPACSFIGYAVSPNKYSPIVESGFGSPYVLGTPSSSYHKVPHLSGSHKPDGRLRSADSSYGSVVETDNEDNDSVWSLDYEDSISDESVGKRTDNCFSKDGDNSRVGDYTASEVSSGDGVSFVKNAVTISKSKHSKKSLISRMLQERNTADVNNQVLCHRRGRRDERDDGENSMARSQSL